MCLYIYTSICPSCYILEIKITRFSIIVPYLNSADTAFFISDFFFFCKRMNRLKNFISEKKNWQLAKVDKINYIIAKTFIWHSKQPLPTTTPNTSSLLWGQLYMTGHRNRHSTRKYSRFTGDNIIKYVFKFALFRLGALITITNCQLESKVLLTCRFHATH